MGKQLMKSELLKTTVLAIAAAALASPTMAKTYAYTFATMTGDPYCDGITIGNAGLAAETWSGNHTGCTNNDLAGGFTTRFMKDTIIEISTADTSSQPALAYSFLLNPKAGTFYVYGFPVGYPPFQLVGEGILIKGAPPTTRRPGAKASTSMYSKAIDKPVF